MFLQQPIPHLDGVHPEVAAATLAVVTGDAAELFDLQYQPESIGYLSHQAGIYHPKFPDKALLRYGSNLKSIRSRCFFETALGIRFHFNHPGSNFVAVFPVGKRHNNFKW
jgi:hypothetical protein